MTDAAQATQEKPAEKEADHHPYYRPKDAATLILVDRSASVPKVLVGKRHDKVVFMPGKFVFPGGRTDPADSRIAVATVLHPEEETKLTARIELATSALLVLRYATKLGEPLQKKVPRGIEPRTIRTAAGSSASEL